MEDPIEEVAAIMDSQDPGGSFGSVARVPINIGELPVGATEVSQEEYDADNENTRNPTFSIRVLFLFLSVGHSCRSFLLVVDVSCRLLCVNSLRLVSC